MFIVEDVHLEIGINVKYSDSQGFEAFRKARTRYCSSLARTCSVSILADLLLTQYQEMI